MVLKICYVGFSGNPGFPNCDILRRFYRQPVFEPTAKETVAQMLANVDSWFAKLREQVATNSSSDTR